MFGSVTCPDNTMIRDFAERSGTSIDSDVPIYVIESKVRKQLKADIERAKIEEKQLKDLQKTLRRRERIKVISCYVKYIFKSLKFSAMPL